MNRARLLIALATALLLSFAHAVFADQPVRSAAPGNTAPPATKPGNAAEQSSIRWTENHNVTHADGIFRTTGGDPWLVGELTAPVPAENRFLVLTVTSSVRTNAELRWCGAGAGWSTERMFPFKLSAGVTAQVVDMAAKAPFHSPTQIRFDPAQQAGVELKSLNIEFKTVAGLTDEQIAALLDFECYTSKLHYEPGEMVPWRASFQARYYPDRASAKVLDIRILNEAGQTVLSDVDHYGVQRISQFKELSGYLKLPDTLGPGRYRLEVVSTDQETGRKMSATYGFGIIAPDAPFMCETPFKFLADFSLIRDEKGLWHIFAISGDFISEVPRWKEDGVARTFSHAVSTDLRHWEVRRPVLSITDHTHPGGKVRYENQNIWAPQVVHFKGRYYMLYTSVNQSVSQSLSLAVSDDLEHWTKHEANPIFTMEGVDWAVWQRDKWADCRDAMIFREGDTFYLYVTAESKTTDGRREGVIGVARSSDLIHWSTPEIALRTTYIPESPQVWKSGGKYYMTTSAGGAATWTSDDPVHGWKKDDFPRPPVREWEKYVDPPQRSYAEEVVPLADGSFIVGSMTFHLRRGNTLYLSKMRLDAQGRPTGYESHFQVSGARQISE